MTSVRVERAPSIVAPAERFQVVTVGIDDVTLGFDMEGSKSVPLLDKAAGVESRRGKMLGERASWGAWSHLLGRSVSFWKSDTKRLYVQTKLGEDGAVCELRAVARQVQKLIERMAAVGILSYAEPWVTRMDVAVDARCSSADGKLLLDALESVRLHNRWRTRSVGVPRSTVYFSARTSDSVYARAYCRNLKLRVGEPFGLIRLEAEHRFGPREQGPIVSSTEQAAQRCARGEHGTLRGLCNLPGTWFATHVTNSGRGTYERGERCHVEDLSRSSRWQSVRS